jgi:hypothetical protein
MFNNGLPVSSLFCKISLLCLPHCLPACIHCTFYSSSFCSLCAIPIQCTFSLLAISAPALHLLLHTCITHCNNNNLITSLSTCTYSFCTPCACNVRHASACSHRSNLLHIGEFSPLHSSTAIQSPVRHVLSLFCIFCSL